MHHGPRRDVLESRHCLAGPEVDVEVAAVQVVEAFCVAHLGPRGSVGWLVEGS